MTLRMSQLCVIQNAIVLSWVILLVLGGYPFVLVLVLVLVLDLDLALVLVLVLVLRSRRRP